MIQSNLRRTFHTGSAYMGFGTHYQTSTPIQLRLSLDKTLQLRPSHSSRTEVHLGIRTVTSPMTMVTHPAALLTISVTPMRMRITLALKNTLKT
jgi:hypothetical protein